MEHSPERQRQFNSPEAGSTDSVPLTDVRVQLALMQMMDADRRKAAELWTTEDERGDSPAKRFRDYVESPEHIEESITVSDVAHLIKIFEKVKGQTLH